MSQRANHLVFAPLPKLLKSNKVFYIVAGGYQLNQPLTEAAACYMFSGALWIVAMQRLLGYSWHFPSWCWPSTFHQTFCPDPLCTLWLFFLHILAFSFFFKRQEIFFYLTSSDIRYINIDLSMNWKVKLVAMSELFLWVVNHYNMVVAANSSNYINI